jgi:seryl-tRNA synthetase
MLEIAQYNMIPKNMLIGAFPDIEKHSVSCRYSDCTHVCEDGCKVIDAIKSRGGELDLTEFAEIDKERRELLQEVETLKNKQNVVSKQIPQLKKEGKDVAPIFAEAIKRIHEGHSMGEMFY